MFTLALKPPNLSYKPRLNNLTMEVQLDASKSSSPNKLKMLPNNPLAQLSQNNARINKCLPQSPSLPMLASEKSTAIHSSPDNVPTTPLSSPQRLYARHAPRNSDIFVKSRIEIFEKGTAENQSYSPMGPPSPVRPSIIPPRAQRGEPSADLQRAILGREEAETALLETRAELEEAKMHQQKVSERLESVLEELAAVKEQEQEDRAAFEKNVKEGSFVEVRKARKECFEVGKINMRLQGDLKVFREKLDYARKRCDEERTEKEVQRQKAVNAEGSLEVMEENLKKVHTELQVLVKAEQHRQAEQLSMAQAELEGVASTKHIIPMANTGTQTESIPDPKGTPMNTATQTENTVESHKEETRPTLTHSFTQPMRPASSQSDRMHKNQDLATDEIVSELRKQLSWMKATKSRDDELIDFMQIECQFKACACRFSSDTEKCSKSHYKAPAVNQKIKDESTTTEAHDTNGVFSNSPKASPAVASTDPAVASKLIEVVAAETSSEGLTAVPEDVPLPVSPSSGLTPEPTAILEDMTQVMVEPALTSDGKSFSFSTSMSGLPSEQHLTAVKKKLDTSTSSHRRTHNPQTNIPNAEDDLFNLSPPKCHPPRPSTALGLSSTTKQNRTRQLQHSPIRVVPNSPQSPIRTIRIPGSRPKSAMSSRTPKSATREAQLRADESGSPVKKGGLSNVKSPTTVPTSVSRSAVFESSVSPSVLPPATPIFRRTGAQTRAEMTVTTMIPLRGMDADDIFSPVTVPLPQTPASSKLNRAETMPLPREIVDGLHERKAARRAECRVFLGKRSAWLRRLSYVAMEEKSEGQEDCRVLREGNCDLYRKKSLDCKAWRWRFCILLA